MFSKHTEGKISIALVYVDDLLLTGDDEKEIQALKQNTEFTIKDLGKVLSWN